MTDAKKAYILALLSVLFWSTVATFFKLTLKYISPYEMLLYAASFASVINGLIIIIKRKRVVFKGKVMVLGILNPFLYYILLFEAYNRLLAQQALCINYLWPVVLVLIEAVFGEEKLTMSGIIGLILGFLGVIFIATKGHFNILFVNDEKGVILALLSTIVWALYWHINKNIKMDAEVKLFQGFLFAIPLLFLVLFIRGIHMPDIRGLLGSLYIGMFEMGITFFLWLSALQLAENVQGIAQLIYLSPFLSLLFISVFLKERLYGGTFIGLLLILLGVYLSKRK